MNSQKLGSERFGPGRRDRSRSSVKKNKVIYNIKYTYKFTSE